MQRHKFSSAIIFLVLAAWPVGSVARAQAPVPAQPEILAQGPIHETFAQPPALGSPQPGPVVSAQPPAPLEELPPEQRPDGANVQWMPGYWQWDDSRNDFIWVSGIWRDLPPGEQWVPGDWQQVQGGWQRVGGFWAPAQQTDLTYLPPPPASLDLGPSAPAPGVDFFYDPGCWIYLETGYRWRPGCWRRFRPGFAWTPACYAWTPAGCVFNDGFWDYPLASRGCLFAPCWFPRGLLDNWSGPWTPQYAVAPALLPQMLFAGPGGRGYYFGNYYGAGYRRAGYTPWFDNRAARWGGDPLFAYYRHNHPAAWARDLGTLYAGRASGRLAALPGTLTQQSTVLGQLNRQGASIQSIRSTSVLTPLSGLSRHGVALTRIGQSQRVRHAQSAAQLQVAARQRSGLERGMVLRGVAPTRPRATPQSVRFSKGGPSRLTGAPGRSLATTPALPGRSAARVAAPPRFSYSTYGQGAPHVARSTQPRHAPTHPASAAPRHNATRPATPRYAPAQAHAARSVHTQPRAHAPRHTPAAPRTMAPRPAQPRRQVHAAAPRVQPRPQARPAAPVKHAQPHHTARPAQPHRAAPAPRPAQTHRAAPAPRPAQKAAAGHKHK
jgi:hypothetical protein